MHRWVQTHSIKLAPPPVLRRQHWLGSGIQIVIRKFTVATSSPNPNAPKRRPLASVQTVRSTEWWNQPKRRDKASRFDGEPSNHREFILSLIRLRDGHPRLTFQELFDHHDLYPELQSTASFNVLLELASQSPFTDNFNHTYEELRRRGFGDYTSQKLRLRFLVLHGQRQAAIVTAGYLNEAVGTEELLELLRVPVQHPRLYKAEDRRGDRLDTLVEPLKLDDTALRTLLGLGTQDPLPIEVVDAVVAYLLYLQRYQDAYALTNFTISQLGENPPIKDLRACLSLIHKHLEIPPATISKRVNADATPLSKVLGLLRVDNRLRPTSTTLAFAIEWLRTRRDRGLAGYSLLERWKRRWGEAVEDSRVRRKIASFALEQPDLRLARKMITREAVARSLGSHVPGESASTAPGWRKTRDDELWAAVIAKYNAKSREEFSLNAGGVLNGTIIPSRCAPSPDAPSPSLDGESMSSSLRGEGRTS